MKINALSKITLVVGHFQFVTAHGYRQNLVHLVKTVMANLFSSIPLDPEILSQTPPEVIELLVRLLAENRALKEEIRDLHRAVDMLPGRTD